MKNKRSAKTYQKSNRLHCVVPGDENTEDKSSSSTKECQPPGYVDLDTKQMRGTVRPESFTLFNAQKKLIEI